MKERWSKQSTISAILKIIIWMKCQSYQIPGNLSGTFTDMEILNADRTPTFLVGIQPDVTVTRTLEGVLKGRDEYIQKALEVIHN
jgi:hypothetical protein